MKKIKYTLLFIIFIILFFLPFFLILMAAKPPFSFKENTIYYHENINLFSSIDNNWGNYNPSDTEILLTYYFDDLYYNEGFISNDTFTYVNLKNISETNLFYSTNDSILINNKKIIIRDSDKYNNIYIDKNLYISKSIILSNDPNLYLYSDGNKNIKIENSILNFYIINFKYLDIQNSSVNLSKTNFETDNLKYWVINQNFEIIISNSYNTYLENGYYDYIDSWITI